MKTMFVFVCLFVFAGFFGPALAQSSGADTVARNQATDAAQAVVALAKKVEEIRADLAVEKKKSGGGDKKKLADLEKKLGELEKKLADELAKPDCDKLTGEAQTLCFKLTSEGTNQRLIEAYEKTLGGTVEKEADGKETYTPSSFDDNGGSETITITEGPNGSFKQVKRVRYAPSSSIQFPKEEDEGEDDVHPVVKWLVPLAGGAILGGGIAGWNHPDGPNGDNYAYGAAGKGALIGAGVGLAVSLFWEWVD